MAEKCVHCGEDCGKHPLIWKDKPFCCNGCKTVYEILNQKDLSQYYSIQQNPGIKIDQPDFGEKYAYLDDEDVVNKLLDFNSDDVQKVSFYIPVIHCASCIWLLENLNTLNPGIIQSDVNFPAKRVSITFHKKQISLRQLVELLASIHYIPEITLSQLDENKRLNPNRKLLLKVGIAGFSFMNTMIYNFPEYLPGGELLEENFRSLFGWLSFALSIPVVFYCASDYFLSSWKGLRHKIVNIDIPIALGIFTLFIQSLIDLLSGSGIGYLDSLTGLVFFLLIGKWYQGKSYQAMSFERDYRSYFPVAVTKLSDGKEISTEVRKLEENDQILIRHNELVPVDAILEEGEGRIDYSFVTGESVPVMKHKGDLIYAGGRQKGGVIHLLVKKKMEQSYLTQLWNQKSHNDQRTLKLENIINGVSKYFTIIIVLTALSAAAYWLYFDKSLALFAFTSVLIIACPCALALTVPFTFGSTLRHFGRRHFYLKSTSVVEKLNKVDEIVFDKTGTLTMTDAVNISYHGEDLTSEEINAIRSITRQSLHPLSLSLYRYLGEGETPVLEDFKELPGLGSSAIWNGNRINVGSYKFVSGKNAEHEILESRVYIFINHKIAGYFRIGNKYRPGLKKLLEKLAKDYPMHLLSGDNASEKETLETIFPDGSNLLFNQSPQDKLKYVQKLKSEGKKVMMIGDGLNDAGALAESDVGISIADDVYQFSPACDAILNAKEFYRIDRFMKFTRYSFGVVYMSFVLSFLYNLVGLYFAVQGALTPIFAAILMPLSSVSVVGFSTLLISLIARKFLVNQEDIK